MQACDAGRAVGLSDQRFLAIRSLIVELAASLDRVERHAAEAGTRPGDDPRWRQIVEALDLLAAGHERAEAVQGLFSDPYDPDWRSSGGAELAGSSGCCG
jgi:hypothetical protein